MNQLSLHVNIYVIPTAIRVVPDWCPRTFMFVDYITLYLCMYIHISAVWTAAKFSARGTANLHL